MIAPPVHQPHAVANHRGRHRRNIPPVIQCGPRPECRDLQVAKMQQASLLLDQCNTPGEVKEVLAIADALVTYARRQHMSQELIDKATALKFDAMTRLGEILENTPKNTGTAGLVVGGHVQEPPEPLPPTLADLGLSKRESADSQKLARMKRQDHELYESVRSGRFGLSKAQQIAKTRETLKKWETLKRASIAEPNGKFPVIVTDPPWPMNLCVMGESTESHKLDYPTRSIPEIEQDNLVAKYADKDCFVFMWTTHRFLPDALHIFEKWGVKYSFTMVWHKDGGMQVPGNPQFNCEFCICGRIGSPVFVDTKQFPACFDAPRTGHSKKPDKFYEIIERATVGPRLDAYNRRVIPGFVGWGNEAK